MLVFVLMSMLIRTLTPLHSFVLPFVLGAVHMSRASPANRADLSQENLYFSTTLRFI